MNDADGEYNVRHRVQPEDPEERRIQDEAAIAKFGKKQQLKRRFKSLSSIGLTCGLMLTWEVVLFTLQFGLSNGGPAGLIYGFIAAWIGVMLQAVVLAEMASMIPLAGGPFNWVAILSPPWCKKFLSYLAGWLTVIAWQAFVAEVCYTCASLIQGIVILTHPNHVPKLWHATLLFYAVIAFGLFINTYLGRILPQIESLTLITYILGFFGVLIPLVYLSPHSSAHLVFTTFQNLGGWRSMGLSFFVGWITSLTSFVGADGADHIAEEIHQASRVIPFSIWFSTLFNGVMGFAMMLAILFSTPDILTATESPTGFPFMTIFETAMGHAAATALVIVITAVNVVSVSSVLATASRMLWAFSRENGLPGSSWIVKVNPESRIPVNAIIVTVVINVLLALISVGSTAAFAAFYSVVLAAYYASFILSAGVMLHKRLTTPASEIPWGPFRLGRFGTPVTVVSLCYTIMAGFFTFWPGSVDVTTVTMNYSSLLFGASILLSMVFWIFYGRKIYVGPVWEFEGQFHRVD
ncbi:amino acid transporter-like protein [Lophiostoma macrostomum CBS 122681]|uniref:Amino acid transporter-like protein n=1 Tax=Lophiostoma macrostomum CBS 122681 TaxID=1314788 RepID=A0A6A6SS15_9PLEO|nr:amino acid transporter-like protein [Lophiostoma macrostomum CBS 122681]